MDSNVRPDLNGSATCVVRAESTLVRNIRSQSVVSSRTLWVEYAKAIGIVLVVYGHVARGAWAGGLYANESQFALVDSLIYSFHMPLFFFLSGLFFVGSFQKRGLAQFVANKLDTLLYPYVIWSVLQGSIEVLLSQWTNSHGTVADVARLLWFPRAQLWFLYALFTISIVAAVFARYLHRPVPGWMVGLAAVAYLFKAHHFGIPALNYLLSYSVFFMMGAYFYNSRWAERVYAHRRALLVPFAIAFVLGQLVYHGVFGLTYVSGGVPTLGLAAVSIAAVVIGCMLLSGRSLATLALIGSASLVIYLLHILLASGSRIVLVNIFHLNSLPTILMVGTLLGVLVPVLVFLQSGRLSIQVLLTPPAALSVERLVRSRAPAETGSWAQSDDASRRSGALKEPEAGP